MDYTGKRAWIYAFIDAPEDNHGALKGQEKELYDYAEQMELLLSGTSTDLGSGHDDNKPGLEQAIAAARDGRFDVLLIKSADRLHSGAAQAIEKFRQLFEMGVTVYSPIEGEITLDSLPLIRVEATV